MLPFLKKSSNEPYVSVDIGTSTIKLMELDVRGEKPKLLSLGIGATPANSINNNAISKPDQIAETIRSIMAANEIKSNKAVIAIPGPCAFTKKVTVGFSNVKDLAENITFEASNYIPHNIDAVHLDYQVLRRKNETSMEVLLVAVKNEIVDSFVSAVELAGLEPTVADVDYFAIENMFDLNYPEEQEKMVALVNVGARYTSINIVQDGEPLFAGDVAVGGRLYTDALCETLNMKPLEAEEAKLGDISDSYDADLVTETIERTTDHVSSELHRQLGFFWNAAASDKNIELVYLSGGSSLVPGLIEELRAKTGVPCEYVNSFRGVDYSENFDDEYLGEIGPSMGVSVGLALRRTGDKSHMV